MFHQIVVSISISEFPVSVSIPSSDCICACVQISIKWRHVFKGDHLTDFHFLLVLNCLSVSGPVNPSKNSNLVKGVEH